jgi:hypothetical protein
LLRCRAQFVRCGREEALPEYFGGDDEALCHAERAIDALIAEWSATAHAHTRRAPAARMRLRRTANGEVRRAWRATRLRRERRDRQVRVDALRVL